MKLSMYILEKWFEKDHPEAKIISGKLEIEGLRMFEEGRELNSNYLYVGKVEDDDSDSGSYNILMMHRNDVILLKKDDLNYVVNRALEAFEFYNELEERFLSAYYKDDPEQTIVSAAENLIGPCFLMQQDYRIMAISQNYVPENVNTFWQSFCKDKEPSLQSIEVMKNSHIVRLFRKKPCMEIFYEKNAFPYSYGIANTYERSDGSVIGYLVIASDTPITEFEKQIAHLMVSALNNLQSAAGKFARDAELKEEGEMLFRNVLKDPKDQRSIDILSVIYNLSKKTSFQLLCLQSSDIHSLPVLNNTLNRSFPDLLTAVYDNRLVALMRSSDKLPNIRPTLEKMIEKTSSKAALSNVFYRIENCYYALDQTVFALSMDSEAEVKLFKNCACAYLLSDRPLACKRAARHSSIISLELYDWENRTDLKNTLKQYLYYDRSVNKTAAAMFIHKNTVLYRINHIRNLCEVGLDDDAEREYLYLSLMI